MRIWRWGVLAVMMSAGAARAQTDVAASLYGAFTGTASAPNISQSPSNAAGVHVELRHISNPLVGYEATYAFNRADERYNGEYCVTIKTSFPTCDPAPGTQYVTAHAHEITAAWIVSLHVLKVRPFLLAGGGVLFHQPSGAQSGTQSQTKGVLVYGGGLDYAVLPHLGIRGQFRGNVYSAPQLATAYSSTGAFLHTAEPMLGAYLRF